LSYNQSDLSVILIKTYKYIPTMLIEFVSVLIVVKMYKFLAMPYCEKKHTHVSQVYNKWPLSCFSHFQWFKIEVASPSNNRLKSKKQVCLYHKNVCNEHVSSLYVLYIVISITLYNSPFSHPLHALRFLV